jgi:cytochrome c oxidase subunit 3
MWPPKGTYLESPYLKPWFNTVLLIASGLCLTQSQIFFFWTNKTKSTNYLILTIIMGLFFLSVQFYEYSWTSICIDFGVYGSTFYALTGFHGFQY